MQQIFFLLLLLACPLSMMLMMRGMGGGGMSHDHGSNDAQAKRLADLEREVAELRATRNEQQYLSTRR